MPHRGAGAPSTRRLPIDVSGDCPLCDQPIESGQKFCRHTGCAARFHKACYLLATASVADIICPACDRCWLFVDEFIAP